MIRLYDESQPELNQNYFNHNDADGNYRMLLEDGKLQVEKWDADSETYEAHQLSETKEKHWLELIEVLNKTGENHLPEVGTPAYTMAMKVIKRADDSDPAILKEKVRLLEQENAKNRKK